MQNTQLDKLRAPPPGSASEQVPAAGAGMTEYRTPHPVRLDLLRDPAFEALLTVQRDRPRPHDGRPQLPRRGVRIGPAAARRHVRRRCHVPAGGPLRGQHRGHRPGSGGAARRDRRDQLPQPRRRSRFRRFDHPTRPVNRSRRSPGHRPAPSEFSGRYRKYKPSSVGRIRPLPCRPDATAANWSLRSGSGLHMPRRRLSRSRHTVGRSPPPDRLRRQAGGGTRAPLPVRPAPDRRSREVRPAPPPTAPPRAAPHGLRSRAG
jgi:hypothetical protein